LFTAPCEAQEAEQADSLAALQQKVQELELQLVQLTGLVIRLESRLLIQEQKTVGGIQSGNHSHRSVEISNLDAEVVRIVGSRCSLSQFGGTTTLNCR
jgi:hypothetical protein